MRTALIISFLMTSMVMFAQDQLIFHNGNKVEGKVKRVTDDCITFVYKGEDAEYTIGVNALSEIKFESGRTQQMSPKYIINSKDDWQNVQVVYDKSRILGLKSLGQVEKHSSGTWSFSVTGGHFSEKTLKKIRQAAAQKGACFILITSQQSKSGDLFSDGHASMTGELYSY